MSWTFTLPFATMSLNETQGMHWSFIRKEKEKIAWSLRSALNRQVKIPLAKGKRKLHITRSGRGRLDEDNLIGGCKALIDAIKGERLIQDDDPAHCELIVDQVVSRKYAPFTTITLEDLP